MNPGPDTAETMPPPAGVARDVAPDLSHPERLGRYRLVHRIGMGGMGVVFVGHDELLDREVAIKLLFRREGPSDAQTRLLREAQALARLAHPNVIAVHEIAEFEDYVFIIMELVVGATLRTWLGERPRTQAELLAVLSQAGAGLAAMHVAGLVHRDIKPDNIMVGNDGRVRVLDFGLARAADDPPEAPAPDASLSSSSLLGVEVTRTGALLGTPGYMAPEQYFHEAPTARSDIFAFCVVLFEAFHGKRPFAGATPLAIRDAIMSGQLREVAGTTAPRWIDAIVRRGLSTAPEDRWPSMEALLAALADDPLARRRRLVRGAALLVLVSALVTLFVLSYVTLARLRAQEAAERDAAAHLGAVEQAVRLADDAGDAPLAEATFEAFLADTAHLGTRAYAGAWQLRGDRARARGDLDGALTGYSYAYVHATADADTTLALRGIADVFHQQQDGRRLGQVLTTLRAREAVDPGLELEAALLERDLPTAAAVLALLPDDHPVAAWRPLLSPLRHGRRIGPRAEQLIRLPPGHDGVFAVDSPNLGLVLLDARLRPIGTALADQRIHYMVPGTSWVSASSDVDSTLVDLFDPERPLWRDPRAVFYGVPLRIPGDPRPALLFSRYSPRYGFRLLRGLGGPAPREQVAHDGTDRASSELTSAVVADLDGDGRDELFTATGAWHDYSVRAFRVDADGALTVLDRRRLGRVGALTVLRRGDERLLAAFKDGSCPNPDVFPTPPHTGDPAGIYLFRWTGQELEQADFLALPSLAEADQITEFAAATDLDGDGVDELVFNFTTSVHSIGVARLLPGRGLGFVRISGARVLAAEQLDDDPAHELFVALTPNDELWALGLGDDPPPRADPLPMADIPTPDEPSDPLLRERWSRAARLISLGLRANAAAILEETSNLALDPHSGARLLDYAAALQLEHGDLAAAIVIDARLAGDPEFGARALARRAAALLRSGRHEEAAAAARALKEHPARTREQTADADALLAVLARLVDPRHRIDLRFDVPLAPQWRLLRPGVLRRGATRDALHFTAASGEGRLAELPFVYEGGPLVLEAELDIHQLEYGACLRLEVLDDADAVWFGAAYCGRGGGGRLMREVRFEASRQSWRDFPSYSVESALTPSHVALRLTYLDDHDSAEFTFDAGGRLHREQFNRLPKAPPGTYRLALTTKSIDATPELVAGELRRLSLRGARLAAPSADAVPAIRLLVEGEPAAALRELEREPAPQADLLRLLASDELRDAAGIASAVAALRPYIDDPAWIPTLSLLLRTRPAPAAALHAALGPALLPLLFKTWYVLEPHRNDAALRRLGLVELRQLDVLVPTRDDERIAARKLLALRGDLHAREGDPTRARRDFTAAVELPPVDDADDREVRRRLHIRLVDLLLAASPSAAIDHAIEALALGESSELTREQLLELPGVAARIGDDPRWRELLKP